MPDLRKGAHWIVVAIRSRIAGQAFSLLSVPGDLSHPDQHQQSFMVAGGNGVSASTIRRWVLEVIGLLARARHSKHHHGR